MDHSFDTDHPICWFVAGYAGAHIISVAAATLITSYVNDRLGKKLAIPSFVGDEVGRRRAGISISSTAHALFVSLASLLLIWKYGVIGSATAQYLVLPYPTPSNAHGAVDPAYMRRVLSVSLGYFLSDFVSIMPDWSHHPEDVVHHLVGIVLTGSCLISPDAAMLGHHILITELSTPLLNVMWWFRKTGLGESLPYQLVAYSFIAIFFITRLMYLPWVAYCTSVIMNATFFTRVPHVALAEICLIALNAWWFSKIIAQLLAFKGKKAPKSGDSSCSGSGKSGSHALQHGKAGRDESVAEAGAALASSGQGASSSVSRRRFSSSTQNIPGSPTFAS